MTKQTKETKTLSNDDKLVQDLLNTKDRYLQASKGRRSIWNDCFRAYMSFIDAVTNPFLANLFIPKTHEAIELLASFFVGSNQSISVEAEGKDDVLKENIVKKLLEFQWRKTIKARDKIVTWVKQGEMFGNGIMKVIWNADKQSPEIIPLNLPDVYFSYYHRNIQESPVIFHRIVKLTSDIQGDKVYDYNKGENREIVISNANIKQETDENRFGAYDATILSDVGANETEMFECWRRDGEQVITIAPTSQGYKIIRKYDNPCKDSDGENYVPFVKLRVKTNPLPNRAYDTGIIEPTLKLQLALNDIINETFDNVTLTNNPVAIEKRGANINPNDLVRRAGQRVKVDDINADIKWDRPPDIQQGVMAIINLLDSEFQQASMVPNILKGISTARTALALSLEEQQASKQLDIFNQNLKEALSELGQMVLYIDLQHISEIPAIKVIDNDQKQIWMQVKPEEINGKYDIRVEADEGSSISKAVRQKQLLDFLNILKGDQATMAKYPDASMKIYKKFLQSEGWGDVNYFFESVEQNQNNPVITANGAGIPTPGIGTGLTPKAIVESVQPKL